MPNTTFIQNFFTSRDNHADGNTYVGQQDRLWYNPVTNSIRVSDGVTPGGKTIDLDLGANATFDIATANTVVTKTIYANSGTVYGELIVNGNISPAAAGKIGGITPGPGVNVSNAGVLTIDTANLPFAFGDFYANVNILSMVNLDENMILAASGNGEIQLTGNVGFYKPDGYPPNVANRYFFADKEGHVSFTVDGTDPGNSAVTINGNTDGIEQTPVNPGVLLQLTGMQNTPSRLYNDGVGGYAGFIARRYNGTPAAPTPVNNGEEIARFGINGYKDSSWLSVGQARISFISTDNQDNANNGTKIEFWSTPKGNTTANITKVMSIDATYGANITGTLSVSGNANIGNLGTAGLITAIGNVRAGNLVAIGNVNSNNAVVSSVAYVGNGATGTSFLNPTIVARNAGATYTQAALVNTSNTGSADYIAYGDNGNDAVAWGDMGFTGSNFNDANYTITGKNDGYFFVQSANGVGLGGNLVIATGNLGITNDIVFATGGFLSVNEKMRFRNGLGQFDIETTTAANSTTTGALRVRGGAGIAGNIYAGGLLSVTGNANVGNIGAATGVFSNLSVTGNVSGNVSGTTITANLITGTLTTNAQPNVTSVGTLTSLSATGNISGANVNVGANVVVTGNIRYDVAQNNGTVTQLTDKTTTVICNGRTGQITTSNSSIAKGAAVTFTVTNSYVTSVTDVPVVVFQSGATVNSYSVSVTRVQVGSFNITITNNGTGPLTDTIIINFAVIKVS